MDAKFKDVILVSYMCLLNPRYAFLKELTAFISRAYEFVPEKEKYYSKRKLLKY